MRRWRIARLVAGKDLRIERRSRVVVNQVLPFAAVTMLMFAFALDATNVLERVAPGLVWLATLFSLLISAYPFVDVVNPIAYAAKIMGTLLLSNLVAFTFYKLRMGAASRSSFRDQPE